MLRNSINAIIIIVIVVIIVIIIIFIIIFSIKRDFLKHKTVKTNDKIRRFGVFMTPLSRKILKRSCKLQHLKRFWREELTKEGAKIVKSFKKIIKILSHEWSLLVR